MINIVGVWGEKMERVNEPILNASDLACYVLEYYKENVSDETMSDIVLQKSLYFLFAFWGGFIRQGHIDENPEVSCMSEILFGEDIEAWTYGPVVAQIYYDRKDGKLDKYYKEEYVGKDELFKNKSFLKITLDGILKDLVKVDPFRLVTISHRDKAWKDKYDGETKHHNVIEKEEIITEYATRFGV